MKANDKVYFGRGPMEFVGVVLSAEAGRVIVSGVETGCLSARRATVEVDSLIRCPRNGFFSCNLNWKAWNLASQKVKNPMPPISAFGKLN